MCVSIFEATGCSSQCIRHSDCPTNTTCVLGQCVLPPDLSIVDMASADLSDGSTADALLGDGIGTDQDASSGDGAGTDLDASSTDGTGSDGDGSSSDTTTSDIATTDGLSTDIGVSDAVSDGG